MPNRPVPRNLGALGFREVTSDTDIAVEVSLLGWRTGDRFFSSTDQTRAVDENCRLWVGPQHVDLSLLGFEDRTKTYQEHSREVAQDFNSF